MWGHPHSCAGQKLPHQLQCSRKLNPGAQPGQKGWTAHTHPMYICGTRTPGSLDMGCHSPSQRGWTGASTPLGLGPFSAALSSKDQRAEVAAHKHACVPASSWPCTQEPKVQPPASPRFSPHSAKSMEGVARGEPCHRTLPRGGGAKAPQQVALAKPARCLQTP